MPRMSRETNLHASGSIFTYCQTSRTHTSVLTARGRESGIPGLSSPARNRWKTRQGRGAGVDKSRGTLQGSSTRECILCCTPSFRCIYMTQGTPNQTTMVMSWPPNPRPWPPRAFRHRIWHSREAPNTPIRTCIYHTSSSPCMPSYAVNLHGNRSPLFATHTCPVHLDSDMRALAARIQLYPSSRPLAPNTQQECSDTSSLARATGLPDRTPADASDSNPPQKKKSDEKKNNRKDKRRAMLSAIRPLPDREPLVFVSYSTSPNITTTSRVRLFRSRQALLEPLMFLDLPRTAPSPRGMTPSAASWRHPSLIALAPTDSPCFLPATPFLVALLGHHVRHWLQRARRAG